MTREEQQKISDQQLKQIEDSLRSAASELFADWWLKPSQYTFPVLGLIFLKYADQIFQETKVTLEANQKPNRFWKIDLLINADFEKEWVLFVPEEASYNYLLNQPEWADYGKLINKAMELIEKENEEKLAGVLPKNYGSFSNSNLVKLLKTFNELNKIDGDRFGLIYEYFMWKFESEAGQKWWEFFTPRSIVKLIVNILEPYHGTIYDPACGSWGMFTQSLGRIKQHKKADIISTISVWGQEMKTETIKMAKMNLAINGLEGKITEANSLYQNIYTGKRFDYVMANPPFNVSGIDKDKLKNDPRYKYGVPSTDNANYLRIQIFANSLSDRGRAGFVMANSASDARHTEQEIRKQLIEDNVVDIMVSVWPNFFYTVALPCTLWFFDKGKKGTDRENKILFIDAKDIFRQIDKSHREFTQEQLEQITDIVRAYRWEDGEYKDVKWLCKVATIEEIEAQGRSLNPGRYVWVTDQWEDEYNFWERLQTLTEEFKTLTMEAHELEGQIIGNVEKLLHK